MNPHRLLVSLKSSKSSFIPSQSRVEAQNLNRELFHYENSETTQSEYFKQYKSSEVISLKLKDVCTRLGLHERQFEDLLQLISEEELAAIINDENSKVSQALRTEHVVTALLHGEEQVKIEDLLYLEKKEPEKLQRVIFDCKSGDDVIDLMTDIQISSIRLAISDEEPSTVPAA